MSESEKKYKLMVFCDNCGHTGEVEIYKGTLVESSECPNCGCNGRLERTTKRREETWKDKKS